jgi:hypothetical protein
MQVHVFEGDDGKLAVVSDDGARSIIRAINALFSTLDEGQQGRMIAFLQKEKDRKHANPG